MDINKRLNDIIFKYNMDRYYPRFRKRIQAEELISKWAEKIVSEDEKVLCIGTDQTDIRYFSLMTGCYQDCFTYIKYDKRELEKVVWDLYDRVFLISLHGSGEIELWCRQHGLKCENLYDCFACAGIIFEDECHRFTDEHEYFSRTGFPAYDGWRNNVLMELFIQKRKLENAKSIQLRRMYLEKIIFLSLYVKNFIAAEAYIRELKKICVHAVAIAAWSEIQLLLREMKDALKSRKKNDIIMFWIDALGYGTGKNMQYLQGKLKDGINFANAFTVTPYTNPTLKTIFCEMKEVDDKAYQLGKIGVSDSSVLQYLEGKEYVFKAVSGYMQLFDGKLRSKTYHDLYAPSSEIFWDALNNLLCDNEKKFLCVHALREAHYPFLLINMKDTEIFDDSRRRDLALEELDAQLKFYNDFLGENIIQIIMSDHGHSPFREGFHVYMSVNAKKFQPRTIKEMFTYTDFHILLRQIIERNDINEAEFARDYVEIQQVDWYNYKRIKSLIKNKEPMSLSFLGYRGVITKEHMYIRFNMGKEWLVQRSNMQFEPLLLNLPDDICDDSLLPYFRGLAGNETIDIYSDEKFKYARYTYKLYDNFIRNSNYKSEIINRLLNKCPEKSIALRMGGDHSAELIHGLTEENRKKIACIIDADSNCRCSNLGYPVVSLNEIQTVPVKAILLSSYDHLNMLKEEAESYGNNIEILDLYEYLEKNGIKWFSAQKNLADEDYDVGFPFADTEKIG